MASEANLFARSGRRRITKNGAASLGNSVSGVTTFISAMRRFALLRHEDETGVSGVGIVAEGVESPDGRGVLFWKQSATDPTKPGSTGFYSDISEMIAIHGHGGRTIVAWAD
jgi:hypothetical protein